MLPEITTLDRLVEGQYYWCYNNVGIPSVHKHPDNDVVAEHVQASNNMVLGPIPVPNLQTISLCNDHHGYGFKSDCVRCAYEREKRKNEARA